MWKNRLCYLLVLLGTGTFFICFNGYLSLYVFVLSLVLPVISLLLSLPGMLGTRFSLTTGRQEDPDAPAKSSSHCARKGASIPLQLAVWNASPFSSGRARARLTVENTFTGQRQREGFAFTAGPQRQVFQHQLTSRTCGMVRCRLGSLRVCDYLGLFSLPVRKPQELSVSFWPAVHPLELEVRENLMPDSEGEQYSQKKPGDDPTELFALRDWQEGDRLSRIHWKLSQKLGRTLVKELGQPLSDHLLFLLDLNGDGLQADLLLDAFASLSNALTQKEHAHRVAWTNRAGLCLFEITQPEDLLTLWQSVLDGGSSKPLDLQAGDSLPTGVSHVLYLCCKPQEPLLALLEDRYPSARLTVLQPAPAEDAPLSGQGERMVLKAGQITQSLNGLTL